MILWTKTITIIQEIVKDGEGHLFQIKNNKWVGVKNIFHTDLRRLDLSRWNHPQTGVGMLKRKRSDAGWRESNVGGGGNLRWPGQPLSHSNQAWEDLRRSGQEPEQSVVSSQQQWGGKLSRHQIFHFFAMEIVVIHLSDTCRWNCTETFFRPCLHQTRKNRSQQ